MKYDPKKKLFYYDARSEEYKETKYPALHTIVYQYDDDLKDFEIVLMNEEEKVDNEDMYNKSCHVFYFDYKTEEYKVAEANKDYKKLYRYDDDLEQFVEIKKPDLWYYKALSATKKHTEKEEEKADNVNHPKHYEGSCSIECIDAMRFALGDEGLAFFCAGNAFKYLWRYKFKNGQEDLDKAKWYMDKLSELSYDNDYNRDTDKVIMKLFEKVKRLYLTVTGKEENAAFEDEEDKDDE